MSKVFYTRHNLGVTLFKDGKHCTVSNTHVNFDKILDALKARRFDDLEDLMSITATVNKIGASAKKISNGSTKKVARKVFVEHGHIKYLDKNGVTSTLQGPLVDRLMNVIGRPGSEKFADALLSFLDNIQANEAIRDELYQWLMAGKAPITYDGCFLAFKKVRHDFKDIYTGLMDNSPGKVVRVNPKNVDPNRYNTCSYGLHFAALDYLQHYGSASSSKIVIVKVNPRHVHAIPVDYSYQKGRASEYFVVGEYKLGVNSTENDAFAESFVNEDNKSTALPNVDLATGWLRPSIKAIAESFGLVVDGRVKMAMVRDKAQPVTVRDGKVFNTAGVQLMSVKPEDVFDRSYETTSVRKALKAALSKHLNR